MTFQVSVPAQFHAGDTVRWSRFGGAYSPDDGWVLSYHFTGAAGSFDATVTQDGYGWSVLIAAADSAKITIGAYTWAEMVTGGDGERYTTATGTCLVLPDVAASNAGVDLRSDAQQALDAITAKLGGRGGQAVDEYEIHGRRLKYTPVADLFQLRSFFQNLVNQEKAAAGQLNQPRRVLLGFGRSRQCL